MLSVVCIKTFPILSAERINLLILSEFSQNSLSFQYSFSGSDNRIISRSLDFGPLLLSGDWSNFGTIKKCLVLRLKITEHCFILTVLLVKAKVSAIDWFRNTKLIDFLSPLNLRWNSMQSLSLPMNFRLFWYSTLLPLLYWQSFTYLSINENFSYPLTELLSSN